MSEKISIDQYGRKKWNVDEYEKDARRKRPAESSNVLSSSATKLVKNNSVLQQRQKLFQHSVLAVKSHTLLAAESGSSLTTYGKNKRFGFFCPICDLSFRDTLALVDHINLPQHAKMVSRVGGGHVGEGELLEAGVRRATTAQVAETLEELVKKLWLKKVSTGAAESLQERVRKREQFEAERLLLRNKKREAKLASQKMEVTEMGKIMGIEGFGSTKV